MASLRSVSRAPRPSSNASTPCAYSASRLPSSFRISRPGSQLDEGVARLASIEHAGGASNNRWYHVVLREGRHRELRAALGTVGLAVNRIIRVRFGPIELGKLRRGASRPLDSEEIAGLYALAGLAPAETQSR